MILDTSAIVAILNNEPGGERLEDVVARSECLMSSVSFLEASIVMCCRRGEASLVSLDAWLETADVQIVPFTASQAKLARNAYARFGKGRHSASLNFGDCATYALAMELDGEVLFTGNDFSKTDVQCAAESIEETNQNGANL